MISYYTGLVAQGLEAPKIITVDLHRAPVCAPCVGCRGLCGVPSNTEPSQGSSLEEISVLKLLKSAHTNRINFNLCCLIIF